MSKNRLVARATPRAVTAIALLLLGGSLAKTQAASTIDAANKYAYGANIGWIDARGDTNNGAVIGEYVCSGYIYSANVGWIDLGSGSPANGIQYGNAAANDFGVNTDSAGNLRGYAYGANIGWINFEDNGGAKVNLTTGKLGGYAYSANCGWISLSNAFAVVQTTTISRGTDNDHNGLPDAWELQNFGHTGVDPNADPDGDGLSNLSEYLAGTDPNIASDVLKITSFSRNVPTLNNVNIAWNSKPTRQYTVQSRSALDASTNWSDQITFGFMGASSVSFPETRTTNFYQIRAYRPLTP